MSRGSKIVRCKKCEGVGWLDFAPCSGCHGSGGILKSRPGWIAQRQAADRAFFVEVERSAARHGMTLGEFLTGDVPKATRESICRDGHNARNRILAEAEWAMFDPES
jgi:hypothetical protein